MMDHGNMDHGGDMDDMCSMNMLFSWSYKNTCVIFDWWHIRTLPHLFFSFLAVMFSAYLYEYLKYYIRKSVSNNSVTTTNSSSYRSLRVTKSIWYGVQVGFSFMLMLVFMTYNGWLMIAVVLGAIWGHYSWGSLLEEKQPNASNLACH